MDSPQLLATHVADFETTTADLIRAPEALALLNFAALLNEVVYLPDTAIGDHHLIIENFWKNPYSGLYEQIRSLIAAHILRVSCRNKVVVGDTIRVDHEPTIREIYEGWLYRDQVSGDSGFTATIPHDVRLDYCDEIDRVLREHASAGSIHWYDPDQTKANFRDHVRNQTESPHSLLSASLTALPTELQHEYHEATKKPRFTLVDLWKVLRQTEAGTEARILHAHINQLCFADAVDAHQAENDRSETSLASFNLELRRERSHPPEVDATLDPPESLDELLERAPVRLQSLGIDLFARLSVNDIVRLRTRAKRLFGLGRRPIREGDDVNLRIEYLRALEDYWRAIMDDFEQKYPDRVNDQTRAALFSEGDLPSLKKLGKQYGRHLITILLRYTVPMLAPFAGPAMDLTKNIGVVLLHVRKPEFDRLRVQVPPAQWWPRSMLNLERKPRT